MMAHLTFEIGSGIALLGWLFLVLGIFVSSTRIRYGVLLFGGRIIPIVLSGLYLFLVFRFWGSSPEGNFSSLIGVSKLFESEGNLAAGWLHFLVFDLFVGRWMIDEVTRANLPKWRLIPCLPLTFLYGPTGLIVFFAFRLLDEREKHALGAS